MRTRTPPATQVPAAIAVVAIASEPSESVVGSSVNISINHVHPSVCCANCGNKGHVYRNCNQPITSCGIICYRLKYEPTTNSVAPEYIMVQRKDSLCYIEFMRGKYSIKNKSYIMKLFTNMTDRERQGIQDREFEDLWKDLWQLKDCNIYMREFSDARSKFSILRTGYFIRNKDDTHFFDIKYVLENTTSTMPETEWGFPKGRRNINEADVQCALREFQEETVVPSNDVVIYKSKPYEEIFTGLNKVRYRHVYFVASLVNGVDTGSSLFNPSNAQQAKEIKDVRWFAYSEAQSKIRAENVERKELLKRVNTAIVRDIQRSRMVVPVPVS